MFSTMGQSSITPSSAVRGLRMETEWSLATGAEQGGCVGPCLGCVEASEGRVRARGPARLTPPTPNQHPVCMAAWLSEFPNLAEPQSLPS